MKKLEGLNERLLPVDIGEEMPPEVYEAQATYRKAFRMILATAKGSVERSLEQLDLGAKLARCVENAVDLEDAEYRLLQECVRQNPTDLIPHFIAQLMRKVQ